MGHVSNRACPFLFSQKRPFALQKAVFCTPKGRQSKAQRPSTAFWKAAFQNAFNIFHLKHLRHISNFNTFALYIKGPKTMKNLVLTILFLAAINAVSAQNGNTAGRQPATPKDTAMQRNDSTETDNSRPIVVRDIPKQAPGNGKMDKNAAKTKRYDAFNEKMKEPWLGGLLKDIISH